MTGYVELQSSMNRMAVQALEKMETRKFKAKGKVLHQQQQQQQQRESSCGASDSLSGSSTSDCAICLEKYIDGEVRKTRLIDIAQLSLLEKQQPFSIDIRFTAV